MALSFVGSAANQASSVTLPAHEVGDLITIMARHFGSSDPPALPSGWVNISANGDAGIAMRVGAKYATTTSEESGSWTGSGFVGCQIYRGASDPGATWTWGVGEIASTSTTVTYKSPAVTMSVGDGTSWIVDYAIYAAAPGSDPTYSGLTLRQDITGGVTRAHGYDSNGGVASWSQVASTMSGAAWRAVAFEIVAASTGTGTVTLPTPSFLTLGVGV